MFAETRLKELEDARRMVVIESDIQRHLILAEIASLHEQFGTRRGIQAQFSGGRPWLLATAAVGGLLMIRHWRALAKMVPSAFALWRWLRSFRSGSKR